MSGHATFIGKLFTEKEVHRRENIELKAELEKAMELLREAYPAMLLLKYEAVMEKKEAHTYIEWQTKCDALLEKKKQ